MVHTLPPVLIAVPAAPASRAAATPRWLQRLGWVHVAATLVLLIAGGLVTSMDAGLAVPDWPRSFGRWWFVDMVGNVLYEHGHRLIAQAVGLLTIVHAVALWRHDPRRWVGWLGIALLGAVILQGVLGGLTVLHYLPTWLSASHGVLAQTFFGGSVAVAYVLSDAWWSSRRRAASATGDALHSAARTATGLVWLQLVLGALLRHQSGRQLAAGGLLADPTFPLHVTHWAGAFAVAAAVVTLFVRVRRHTGNPGLDEAGSHGAGLVRATTFALAALLLQVLLGVVTLGTGIAPWAASAHQVNGALILGALVLAVLQTAREVPR